MSGEDCSTRWRCEECGATGIVNHEQGAGVYTVLDLLKRSHAETTDQWCSFDLGRVRVELIQ